MLLTLIASLLEGLGVSAIIPLLAVGNDTAGQQNSSVHVFFAYIFSVFDAKVNLSNVIIFIVGLFFLKFLVEICQQATSAYIYSWLTEHIEKGLVERYNKITYQFFSGTEIGYFNNVISREAGTVSGSFRTFVTMLIAGLSLIVYLTFSVYINWLFTSIVVISGIILHLTFSKVRARVTKLSQQFTTLSGKHQNILIQCFNNFKYLKATATNDRYLTTFLLVLRALRINRFKRTAYNGYTIALFEFVKVVMICTTVLVATKLGSSDLATIIVPLLFMNRSLTSVMAYQANWQKFLSSSGAIKAVGDATSVLDINRESSGAQKDEAKFPGEIGLEDVCFQYDEGAPILNGIELTIPPNEALGIVGRSGAGKTTLIDLIAGLLNPTSGVLRIGGKNYNSILIETIRNNVGYVSQASSIFNETVEENVKLWTPVDRKKLIAALDFAGLEKYVEALPEQERTIVGQDGVKMSGGQKQRLSIAREIYRDPSLLIFDEATSALDSITESAIQDSIKNLKHKKTLIIVSHRLSTLRMCDRIIVLDQGKIVEEGDWQNLSKRNGHFSELCRSQGIT